MWRSDARAGAEFLHFRHSLASDQRQVRQCKVTPSESALLGATPKAAPADLVIGTSYMHHAPCSLPLGRGHTILADKRGGLRHERREESRRSAIHESNPSIRWGAS